MATSIWRQALRAKERGGRVEHSIEIAVPDCASSTARGDLLEDLAADLLRAQNYEVTKKLRIAAAELDLLCVSRVSGKQVYVECKGQRSNIDAPILRQLWGTVDFNEYSEGWLISTAPLGQAAKGFVHEWKSKPLEKAQRLSFYTPENVCVALERAGVIKSPPVDRAADLVGGAELLGSCTLMITPFGRYWGVFVLSGGVAESALIFHAKSGALVEDDATLTNLESTDSSVSQCDIRLAHRIHGREAQKTLLSTSETTIVEVQTGDSWDDYRPARASDFVGRRQYLSSIFGLLSEIGSGGTATRVFSITGNSGLGKSSLIANLREKSRGRRYRSKHFIYAVDVRGARSPSYIAASLLACFRAAQDAGFCEQGALKIENPDSPFSSDSMSRVLSGLGQSGKVLCLIFDQFEELYSKPELSPIFDSAKNLMVEIAGLSANICVGFAWKSDFTVQGDHRAYHMWHGLSDFRRDYRLELFSSTEISSALTLFEKQVGRKIKRDLRHQMATSCQGFPWLLKKLCINLYGGMQRKGAQGSLEGALDIAKLFESDIEPLVPAERTCLKLVADKAPADWSEIIDIAGLAALNGLINRRLVVRSGDRLNVYWDIFKDYLLSGKVPALPLNYIPTNEFSSISKVAKVLAGAGPMSAGAIAERVSLSERTIINICADLVMFGVVGRTEAGFALSPGVQTVTDAGLLERLRVRLGAHSFKIELYRLWLGKAVDPGALTEILRRVLPNAEHDKKTRITYVKRMARYLSLTGYLVPKDGGWVVRDVGGAVPSASKPWRTARERVAFTPLCSPVSVVRALSELSKCRGKLRAEGFPEHRTALFVLGRFQLVFRAAGSFTVNTSAVQLAGGESAAIWSAARNEWTLLEVQRLLRRLPEVSAKEIGTHISDSLDLGWRGASCVRYGNVLRQWAKWLVELSPHFRAEAHALM